MWINISRNGFIYFFNNLFCFRMNICWEKFFRGFNEFMIIFKYIKDDKWYSYKNYNKIRDKGDNGFKIRSYFVNDYRYDFW